MKRNLRTLLVAAAAGAMLTMAAGAMAQAPGGGPGAGGPPRAGGGAGGFNATPDRAGTIQRFGLNDAALKLSDAQKTEIDKAADAYVAEMKTVNDKYPMAQGSPPSQEATAARTKASDNLAAAVNKVLNDEQKKTWETARAQQRRGGPGGGMGGPGGPGGPPGGMRGPGGPGGPPGGGPPPGQ